jgi:hypothetical protein
MPNTGSADLVLTVEILANAVGMKRADVELWNQQGYFWSGGGLPGRFAIEDAVVLFVADGLVSEMNLGPEAAFTHADRTRGWRRGHHLLVATAPVAITMGLSPFTCHHAVSDTYSGLLPRKDLFARVGRGDITHFDSWSTFDLGEIQRDVIKKL